MFDHITSFYDRHIRLWTCTWHDAEGNQLGCAQYAPRRKEKDELLQLMEQSEPCDFQV